MEVIKNDAKKQVEVWLTRAEASCGTIRHGLKPLFSKYKAQGYRIAVFESGKRDLYASTRDLLLTNRVQKTPAPKQHTR